MSDPVKIEVARTETRSEKWDVCNAYCVECGRASLVREIVDGPLVFGVRHVCLACDAMFWLMRTRPDLRDAEDVQRLARLKTAFAAAGAGEDA